MQGSSQRPTIPNAPGQPRMTSRPHNVEVRLRGIQVYEGEIIDFNGDLLELRFKASRRQKLDVKVVSLNDPNLIMIYGDLNAGGPGIVVMWEELVAFKSPTPLYGFLGKGPNGMVHIHRQGNIPVFIRPEYAHIVNEDGATAPSIGKASPMKAGNIAPLFPGKSPPPKFQSRPPAGSPAAKAAGGSWT